MDDILVNFWSLAVMMALGFMIAKLKIVGPGADKAISRLIYNIGLPALMFQTVARADIHEVFDLGAAVNVMAATLTLIIYWFVAGKGLRISGPELTIGTLCAGYVNAGNVGVALLVAVVGDPTAAAPIMLYQLTILVPIFFTILDVQTGHPLRKWWQIVKIPLTNPPVVGVLVGLVFSALSLHVPAMIAKPVGMLSGVTVPLMLLAIGISGASSHRPQFNRAALGLHFAVVMRCFVTPGIAWAIGSLIGLEGNALLAVIIVAALPTANNVFVYAHRYSSGVDIARDSVVVTTVTCLPVVLAVSALFATF